jgi:hydrogenase maturation protease
MKKTIIIGVGNPILRDDGIGIHVAEELKKQIKKPNVTIDSAFTGGMNLLDLMVDHDRAILIDAVKRKEGKLGDVNIFGLGELSAFHTCNPHDVSLPQAVTLAKKLGQNLIPKDIKIVGINIGELNCEFGEELSGEVAKAVPKAVEIVKKEVKCDE